LTFVLRIEMGRKHLETMLKRRRTVLHFAEQEVASMTVVVCHDRGASRSLLSSYEHSKFATQNFDFCAPYKIGRNYAETVPHGVSLCRAGSDERDGCGVP